MVKKVWVNLTPPPEKKGLIDEVNDDIIEKVKIGWWNEEQSSRGGQPDV